MIKQRHCNKWLLETIFEREANKNILLTFLSLATYILQLPLGYPANTDDSHQVHNQKDTENRMRLMITSKRLALLNASV